MNVEVKDLREGDEIIISSYSDLKYLIVLKDPSVGKNKHWNTGQLLYKAVKCSIRRDVLTTRTGWEYKKNICTPEGHNEVIYQDLNYRAIWLVKRK